MLLRCNLVVKPAVHVIGGNSILRPYEHTGCELVGIRLYVYRLDFQRYACI